MGLLLGLSVTLTLAGLIAVILLVVRQIRLTRRLEHEKKTLDVFLAAFARQAEFREAHDYQHLARTASYVRLLVDELVARGVAKPILSRDFRLELVRASILHDVGKSSVPDEILLKAGPLTPAERAVMEQHCEKGEIFLRDVESQLAFPSFLSIARNLAISHHEKWDGTGYPFRLEGDEIPLEGRIVALVDVYDALRRKKVYKDAIGHDECVRVIYLLSGRQFDPDVVEAFLACQEEFRRLSEAEVVAF